MYSLKKEAEVLSAHDDAQLYWSSGAHFIIRIDNTLHITTHLFAHGSSWSTLLIYYYYDSSRLMMTLWLIYLTILINYLGSKNSVSYIITMLIDNRTMLIFLLIADWFTLLL